MPVNDVLAGIAVADHDSAVGWYENLLGRPPDTTPMPGWPSGISQRSDRSR